MNDRMFPVTGTVDKVNYEAMRASVIINMPNGKDIIRRLDHVPITLERGYSQSGPYIGDRVLVAFESGSLNAPYIIAVLDYDHDVSTRPEQTKHVRKGPYVPDYICNRQSWEIKDSDWQWGRPDETSEWRTLNEQAMTKEQSDAVWEAEANKTYSFVKEQHYWKEPWGK